MKSLTMSGSLHEYPEINQDTQGWPNIDEDFQPSQLEDIQWPVVNPEVIDKALAGDEISRQVVNAHLEAASPDELLDPSVEPLLNLSSVRQLYLFPAVAQAAKQAHYQEGFSSSEAKLIQKTFDLLGFVPQQSQEIWRSWNSYSVKYYPSDQKEGKIPAGKKVWDISDEKADTLSGIIRKNLNRMEDVHAEDPEALQVLFKRDHIRNFGRYDQNTLIMQAQSNEAPDRIMVTMAEDHNGAGSSMAKNVVALSTGLGGEKRTRFVEAATSQETHQLLKDVSTDAGPLNDVVFFVHANGNRLVFSERPGGSVNTVDVWGSSEKEPFLDNTVISHGANILIIGCEAGVKDGIAAAMAKKLNVTVRSPDVKTRGLVRTTLGRLKSLNEKGEEVPIPTYRVNPVRALALQVRSALKNRRQGR